MKKILIIEDDVKIAEFEKDYLEANGYYVDVAYRGQDGIEKFKNGDYNLIILDIMLPDMDGFEIFKELSPLSDIPVLFVTAKNQNLDKIKGFGIGGADYIVKPFEPLELVARIDVHIRRYDLLTKKYGRNSELIIIGDLTIEEKSRKVYLKNQEVLLPNKEFEFLYFLATNQNIVFNKQQLLDRVWGEDSFADESTVVVHINRIRYKIELDSSQTKYIETLWGTGYRFKKIGALKPMSLS